MKKIPIFKILPLFFIMNLTAQSVCQEQLINTSMVSGVSLGQSIFMSGCSGFFSSIELNRSEDGTEINAELEIFSGQTFLGTPLYTQAITIPATAGPFTINFNSGTGDLSFFEDSQYTFMISGEALQLEASSDVDLYSDGQLFVDVGFINNDDLWFRLNVSSTLAINTPPGLKQIKMYPNPAQDSIQLIGLESHQNYTIFNALGVRMMQGTAIDNQTIDVQSLSNGIYFLRLEDAQTIRFVKGY